jgi:Ras family protein A
MDAEIIRILLVGDEKCGKTTFLSRLSVGEGVNPIPLLRDIDQPFIFEIKLGANQYRLEFYDTSSPENWRLLDPDVVVLCYDITQRLSLINMKRYVRYPFPQKRAAIVGYDSRYLRPERH